MGIANQIAPKILLTLCLITILLIIISIGKHVEPPYSFILDEQGLSYYHRRGSWTVPWSAIMQIDQVTTPSPQSEKINLIGLRLRDPSPHIMAISTRLALTLIVEQQSLLQKSCPLATCNAQHLVYTSKSKSLSGVIAAYQQHIHLLRQYVGYDLYLPINCFDRPVADALKLLKQYQKQANSYQKNT